jgi:hypothetical protein
MTNFRSTLLDYAAEALGREVGFDDCRLSTGIMPTLQVGTGDTRVIFVLMPYALDWDTICHYSVTGVLSAPQGATPLFGSVCSVEEYEAIKAALIKPETVTKSFIAGEKIKGGRMIYIGHDGKVYNATTFSPAIVGVATHAAEPEEKIEIAQSGE